MSPGTSWISARRVGMQPVSGDGKFACSHAHGTNKIGIASNHDIQQGLELPQVSNSPLGLLLFYPVFNLGIFGHFWGYGHDLGEKRLGKESPDTLRSVSLLTESPKGWRRVLGWKGVPWCPRCPPRSSRSWQWTSPPSCRLIFHRSRVPLRFVECLGLKLQQLSI